MNASVNGEPRILPDGSTVAEVIASLHLAPGRVAAEVNGVVVRRADHARHVLRDGDVVELVAMIGGG